MNWNVTLSDGFSYDIINVHFKAMAVFTDPSNFDRYMNASDDDMACFELRCLDCGYEFNRDEAKRNDYADFLCECPECGGMDHKRID